MIVTTNKPFSAWGDILGDEVTAAAMIDRLVHHAEILALKGDSYRLKDRDLARTPPGKNCPPLPQPRAPELLRLGLRPRLRSTGENTRRVVHFSTGATGPRFA